MRPKFSWKLSMLLALTIPFTAQAVSIKGRLRAFVGRPAKASDTAEQLTPDENRIRDMQNPEIGAVWVSYIKARRQEVATSEVQRETEAKAQLNQVLENTAPPHAEQGATI